MHMLSWLSPKGTAAIVEFPGVLYRDGAEQKIRQYMVDNNFVDTIIQLPSDLFFGTSIATCILVLKKNKTDNSVLFIDASKEFVRNTNKNKLSNKNIEDILKLIKDRANVENKSVLVPREGIEENDYNLSVSTYVEQEDTREHIDIDVLNKEIDEIVERENILRDEIKKIISEIEV
jgi:type I restriction enzyme M protein